jgi:outer membrane protein
VLLLLIACLTAQAAAAADLLAVYQRALQNDPQLREAEANRLAALEAKPQALSRRCCRSSTAAPRSRRSATRARQHQVESVSLGPGTAPSSSKHFRSTARRHDDDHIYRVDLKQNLFNWQNWVALKSADAQVAQAEADYQAAQQDLIERVAQRYFDVLAAQDDLEAQEAALASINRQLDQAESRYQIGLIAVTDVEEARAAHDSSAAAVINAKRTLATNQELLREITGDAFDYAGASRRSRSSCRIRIRSTKSNGCRWPCSRISRWSRAGWRRTSRART